MADARATPVSDASHLLRLHQAIRDDTADVVAVLLADGGVPAVNTRDAQGDTPLLLATMFCSTDIVEMLLTAGATEDLPNHDMQTPLMLAAIQHDVVTLGLLLEGGADVLFVGAMGATALEYAVAQGCDHAIGMLLAFGATLGHDEGGYRSLLVIATGARSVRAMNRLIQDGAALACQHQAMGLSLVTAARRECQFVDEHDANALAYARNVGGNDASVELLLAAEVDVEHADSNGFTPLHNASVRGNPTMVSALLASGADVGALVKNSVSSFVLSLAGWCGGAAVTPGYRAVVKILLAAGARVDEEITDGVRALHFGLEFGDTELVELLLAFGADPAHANESGYALLMNATSNGHTRIVQTLMDAQADVNATTTHGDTACSKDGNGDLIAALIAGGDDPNIVTTNGSTPLGEAMVRGDSTGVEMLLGAGASGNSTVSDGDSVLSQACAQCDVAIVRHLLAAGSDVNRVEADTQAVLVSAAAKPGYDDIRNLLEFGATKNIHAYSLVVKLSICSA